MKYYIGTPLAKELSKTGIFIHHSHSGDYILEGDSFHLSVLRVICDIWDEENENYSDLYNKIAGEVQSYTLDDCIEAVMSGNEWPLNLGLIEELMDDGFDEEYHQSLKLECISN